MAGWRRFHRKRLEFCFVGLLEYLTVRTEVIVADEESRLCIAQRSTISTMSLLGLVDLQVLDSARRPDGCRQKPKGGPFVPAPYSEVKDHVHPFLQCIEREPDQSPFEDIALTTGHRFAKQRNHPLVRRQSQRLFCFRTLFGPRRFSGRREPNHDEHCRDELLGPGVVGESHGGNIVLACPGCPTQAETRRLRVRGCFSGRRVLRSVHDLIRQLHAVPTDVDVRGRSGNTARSDPTAEGTLETRPLHARGIYSPPPTHGRGQLRGRSH
jgi:hypothetical protein